ncbi:MAG: transketolase [Bacteroidales bacterium]|nr:transketolase [Bacteroidales bacterium]
MMVIDDLDLIKMSQQVRRDILRMIYHAKSGHPGGALGCADFMVTLYFSKILKHSPETFTLDGIGEDVFILSNGHLSALWYSVLARCGYFPLEELSTFRKINSRLQGHPTNAEGLPGIRISTGSLGQGLSVAIGFALGKKLHNDPYHVFCLMGDGEIQEGQIWEAAMFAGAKNVDNLIAIVDWNNKQIDGPVSEVLNLGNLHQKWQAFGFEVLEMDGHNHQEIYNTLLQAKRLSYKGKPIVILMHTIMGKGVSFMENNHKWHGSPPNEEQFNQAIREIPETYGDF